MRFNKNSNTVKEQKETFQKTLSQTFKADISGQINKIIITAQSDRKDAQVHVFTPDDPESESARAVRDTTIVQKKETLRIRVPERRISQDAHYSRGGSRGNVVIQGSYVAGDLNIISNSVIYRGSQGEGVTVHVTLPRGSHVQFGTANGKFTSEGHLATVSGSTTNGSIFVDSADKISLRSNNGVIHVGTANETLDVKTSNGSILVDLYQGTKFLVSTSNGRITARAGSEARGKMSVRTSNAIVTLRGVVNRSDLVTDVRTSNGTIHRLP